MQTYLSDIIPKIQRFSRKLDDLTLLTNQHWVVIDDITKNKYVYIFRGNNELLVSSDGKVGKGRWEYLGNNSLLIDIQENSYLYKHGFFDQNVLALKVDGKEEYFFLVNENKYDGELNSIDKVADFLNKSYLNPNIQKTIDTQYEIQNSSINTVKKRVEITMIVIFMIVGILVIFFVFIDYTKMSLQKEKEKKMQLKEESKKEKENFEKEEAEKERIREKELQKTLPVNSALKLAMDFKSDVAGMKGKETTVSGVIITSTTVKNNGIDEFQITVKDTKEDKMGAFCVIPLKDGRKPNKKVGDKITVRGKITDRLFDDVKLTDCVIIE